MDHPTGNYMFSLGKRVGKLERDVEHLERGRTAPDGGGYSRRQKLKPRFTPTPVLATDFQLHDPASYT
jgi:hypothetical protein